MRRLIAIMVGMLFVVWILPLGIFIKPEQEERACNGQRAICMCSHSKPKVESKATAMTLFRSVNNANQKENTSSMSPDFLIESARNSSQQSPFVIFPQPAADYQFSIVRSIDHVPKV